MCSQLDCNNYYIFYIFSNGILCPQCVMTCSQNSPEDESLHNTSQIPDSPTFIWPLFFLNSLPLSALLPSHSKGCNCGCSRVILRAAALCCPFFGVWVVWLALNQAWFVVIKNPGPFGNTTRSLDVWHPFWGLSWLPVQDVPTQGVSWKLLKCL